MSVKQKIVMPDFEADQQDAMKKTENIQQNTEDRKENVEKLNQDKEESLKKQENVKNETETLNKTAEEKRNKIKRRVRKNICGSSERPRLSVFRSNKQIYAQIIDDVKGITLASASSFSCSEFFTGFSSAS